MILSKLKETSAGIDCKFSIWKNHAARISSKNWSAVPESRQQKVIMKSPRLVTWRYKYLIKVQKYSLNKTWFVSHDTVRMLWSDDTKSCSL